jgi:hypothetical protein
LEPGGKLCPAELVHVITDVVSGTTADKVTGRAIAIAAVEAGATTLRHPLDPLTPVRKAAALAQRAEDVTRIK